MIAMAAAGVAVAAFFLLRDGDEAAATGGASTTAGTSQPDRDVPGAAARNPARVTPNDRRDVADPDAIEVGHTGKKPPVVYDMEDGTHVADHRDNPTPYLRPGLVHPSMSPVDGKVSTAVLRVLRPVVLGCLGSAPDDAFTDDALVMARAVISIDADGNLTATELGAGGTGIDEAQLAAAVTCIQDAAATIHAHVDHEAVETATLAFPIRPLAFRH